MFQQQRQALKQNTQAKKPEIFQKGQLVYLVAPSAVSLQTNTKKCCADFVGPLVINRVLDKLIIFLVIYKAESCVEYIM